MRTPPQLYALLCKEWRSKANVVRRDQSANPIQCHVSLPVLVAHQSPRLAAIRSPEKCNHLSGYNRHHILYTLFVQTAALEPGVDLEVVEIRYVTFLPSLQADLFPLDQS